MPDKKAWLDFAVYVEGEAAQLLCEYCRKIWNRYSFKINADPCKSSSADFIIALDKKCKVRVRRNDWISHQNEISATYIEMLRNAKHQVTILCSYFLPGKFIRRLLANASKRGVVIKVVTAGPTDILLAKKAERWLYDWLLRNKIMLYEYKTNVLHGKIAVCDDSWVTVGSYNINNISAYASMELNLDIQDDSFSKNARVIIEDIIENECQQITNEIHLKRKNMIIQFSRWCSYQIIRIVFKMFTFYFKQDHRRIPT
jgi:cardiolipin synthase